MIIKNSLNVSKYQTAGKVFKGVSMAIPDQTMSLKTILERYARGLSIDGEKTPIYDEEGLSMGIHPKSLDLVDIQELQIENKQELETLNERVGASERRRKEERANLPHSEEEKQ